MRRTPRHGHLLPVIRPLVVVSVFALLMAVVVVVADQSLLHFDEALHLNLATTLATTGWYASLVGGQYRLFDPQMVGGPAVIGPTALAIRLFGPDVATVRALQITLFGVYLGLLFLAVRQLTNWGASLFLLVCFVATPLVLHLGLSVLGEFTAAVFLVVALAALDRAETVPPRRRRWLIVSGICLGTALLAHNLAMFLVVALTAVVMSDGVAQRRLRVRTPFLVPVGIALAMALGWRAVQVVTVLLADPAGFAAWSTETTRWTLYLGKHFILWPLAPRGPKLEHVMMSFGAITAAFGLALSAWIVLRYHRRRPLSWDPDDRLARRTLALATLGWLGWFLVLSGEQASARHLLLGMVLGEVFVVQTIYLLARSPASGQAGASSPATARALAAMLVGLLAIGAVRGAAWNLEHLAAMAPVRAEQAAVAAWVDRSVPPEAYLAGWGWFVPWDIAFLTGHMPHRVEVTTTDLNGIDWLIIVPELGLTGSDDARLRGLLARQADRVFQAGGYEVYAVRASGGPAPTAAGRLGLNQWRERP